MIPRALATALIVIIAGGVVFAQARWAEPYRRGLEAIRDSRWKEAVTLLTTAIGHDDRQSEHKREEGTFTTRYYPFLYLGLAQLRLGQLQDASRNLTRAVADPMPADETAELRRYQAELSAAVSAANTGPSLPPADDRSGQAQAAIRAGDQFLASGRLNDAEARYADANRLAPGVANRQLTQVRDRRDSYGRERTSAAQHRAAGRLADAAAALARALTADPENYAADGIAAEAQAIQVELTRAGAGDLARRGLAFANAGDYQQAAASFRAALDADAANNDARTWLTVNDQFQAVRNRARALASQSQWSEAQVELDNARRLDSRRFAAEGLDRLATTVSTRLGSPTAVDAPLFAPIEQGLAAYLRGELQVAIDLLGPVVARASEVDPGLLAHAHAYLGVAYAEQALASREADAERTLRDRAMAQFDLALQARPDYRLSPLVSPRIHEMLESARIGR